MYCVLKLIHYQFSVKQSLSTGTVRDYPANMADRVELKVVLVGPPGSGKSSMILSLTANGTFKTVHSPTTFDNYTATIEDGQKRYRLR